MVVNSPLRSTDSMPHAVSGVARAKLDKVVCHKVPASRVRAKVDGVVCLKVPASRVRHKVDRVKVNRVRVAQVRAMALEKAKATRPAVGKVTPLETSAHGAAWVKEQRGKAKVPVPKAKGKVPVPKAKGKVTPLETSAHAAAWAKAKGLVPKAKAKGLVPKAKAKGLVPKAKAKGLVPKAKGKVTPLETSAHAGEFGTRASVDRPPLLHSPDHS